MTTTTSTVGALALSLVVVALLLVLAPQGVSGTTDTTTKAIMASECQPFLNCSSCLAHTKLGISTCAWCYQDQVCHDVGSPQNPCSAQTCASRSRASICNLMDCSGCAYPTCNEVKCCGKVVPLPPTNTACLCTNNCGTPCNTSSAPALK